MKLYLIHCGFYDEEISEGIYEFHVNIPVIARDTEDAKKKVRLNSVFIDKKMHIDGIQKIQSIEGYAIRFEKTEDGSKNSVKNIKHRDL